MLHLLFLNDPFLINFFLHLVSNLMENIFKKNLIEENNLLI